MVDLRGNLDLFDVVVVISWWFGGIKLGIGGFIWVYGNVVSNVLIVVVFY